MARILTAIIKEPGWAPEIVEIPDELENYQRIVDGYIECVRWDDEHVLIVNEEGKLRGLDKNFRYGGDIIVGIAIWIGVDGEDFTDIQPGLIDEVEDFTGYHRYDLDDEWQGDLEDLVQTALGGEPIPVGCMDDDATALITSALHDTPYDFILGGGESEQDND